MSYRRRLVIVAVLAVFSSVTTPAQAEEQIVYRTIVQVGDPTFDDPSATFSSLSIPRLNNNGLLAFRARTQGPGGILEGVFGWQAGTGQMVALEGQPLAQHPTAIYKRVGRPKIDESGQFLFFADYSSSAISGVVVAGFPGDLRIIAWAGNDTNPDPDYVSQNLRLGSELLSRQGSIGIQWGGGGLREIWGGDTAGIELLAFPNMPAPGYPPGATMCCYGFSRLNGQRQVVTAAAVSGFTVNAALLAGPEGANIPVGPDVPTPGLAGTFIAAGGISSSNAAGDLGIRAAYLDEETGEVRVGLWVGRPDSLQLIAIEGMAAPGLPDGQTYTRFYGSPIVTPSGRAVFGSYVTDDTTGVRRRIWGWDGNDVTLLVRDGDPIVNMDGATFSVIFGDSELAVNDGGQIAMIGRVNVPGSGLVRSLLVTDLEGRLHSVATAGQPFEVAPGDVRTIENVSVVSTRVVGPLTGMNGDDGFGTFFNDSSQLAFQLDFEDGTNGIFTATVGFCPWDLDGDGVVSVPDLRLLLGDFGTCDGSPADFDGDGCVTVSDLLTLIFNFGPCPDGGCPWDVNGDGTVDRSDLRQVLGNLGPCDGCPEDVDGDGVVDFEDVIAVATHFGSCP